jgi:hypothetical protein
MTALRAKFIRGLTVRGRAHRTQRAYIRYVSELALHYKRSPELISYEEVTDWLYHLITERQLAASSVKVAVNAVRFLYGITLGRDTEALTTSAPHIKQAICRPLECSGCRTLPDNRGRLYAIRVPGIRSVPVISPSSTIFWNPAVASAPATRASFRSRSGRESNFIEGQRSWATAQHSVMCTL